MSSVEQPPAPASGSLGLVKRNAGGLSRAPAASKLAASAPAPTRAPSPAPTPEVAEAVTNGHKRTHDASEAAPSPSPTKKAKESKETVEPKVVEKVELETTGGMSPQDALIFFTLQSTLEATLGDPRIKCPAKPAPRMESIQGKINAHHDPFHGFLSLSKEEKDIFLLYHFSKAPKSIGSRLFQ